MIFATEHAGKTDIFLRVFKNPVISPEGYRDDVRLMICILFSQCP